MNFLKLMGGMFRDYFILLSCQEASGFINYRKEGGTKESWDKLDASECLKYVEKDNVVKYVKDSGWIVDDLMIDWYGLSDKGRWEKLPPSVSEFLAKENKDVTQAEIERILCGPYPQCGIPRDSECHIGHIMHGLVNICKQNTPDKMWSQHVCILDASMSTEDFVQVRLLQDHIKLLMLLLCSESHWALSVASLSEGRMFLFDGKQNPAILEKAKERALNLGQGGKSLNLHMAQIPSQVDEWSCGHRVLLAADYVLSFGGEQIPNFLPDHVVAPERFESLYDMSGAQIKTECNEEIPVPPVAVKRMPNMDSKLECKRCKAEPLEDSHSQMDPQPSASGTVDSAPATPPRRKRSIPDKGDSPKEPVKKLSKRELKSKINEIQKQLQEKGLEHNAAFQKRHASLKILPSRGHWQDFLRRLVGNEDTQCEACRQLVDEFVRGVKPPEAQGATEAVGEAPTEDCDSTVKPRRRGRPRKGVVHEEVLKPWIEQNRKGIYIPSETSSEDFIYHCVPCSKKLKLFRDALTYLHQHERDCTAHALGLATLGLSVSGEPVGARAPCQGASWDHPLSTIKTLTFSLPAWFSSRQPSASGYCDKKSQLEMASWRLQGDCDFVIRHASCTGTTCLTCCSVCLGFVQSKKLAMEIASWGYRVDLAVLAKIAAYGTDKERSEHQALMKTRDYLELGFAGSDFDDVCRMKPRSLIAYVRRAMESVQKNRRNAAYQAFINLRLHGLTEHVSGSGNLSRDMFANLIHQYHSALSDGTCLQEDSRLILSISLCYVMLRYVRLGYVMLNYVMFFLGGYRMV